MAKLENTITVRILNGDSELLFRISSAIYSRLSSIREIESITSSSDRDGVAEIILSYRSLVAEANFIKRLNNQVRSKMIQMAKTKKNAAARYSDVYVDGQLLEIKYDPEPESEDEEKFQAGTMSRFTFIKGAARNNANKLFDENTGKRKEAIGMPLCGSLVMALSEISLEGSIGETKYHISGDSDEQNFVEFFENTTDLLADLVEMGNLSDEMKKKCRAVLNRLVDTIPSD